MIIIDERFRIPHEAEQFEGFRCWVESGDFPETGRIDYLAGDVEIEMSPEDLHTHGVVKAEIAARLHALAVDHDLGEVFVDRARVVHRTAGLSAEPDVVLVLWPSLEYGRVRYVSASDKGPGRFSEIEGAPDLLVEIVSDGSERKDNERLPRLYAAAGIPELWLVDARGGDLRFQIHTLREGRYSAVAADPQGWLPSPVLGARFRLVRQRTRLATWRYRLEQSPL
jgi:Uma2 family endonuclease